MIKEELRKNGRNRNRNRNRNKRVKNGTLTGSNSQTKNAKILFSHKVENKKSRKIENKRKAPKKDERITIPE